MDPEYDNDLAVERLQGIINVYKAGHDEETRDISTIDIAKYKVVYTDQPRSWRIIQKDDRTESEESVFNIHGILCGSDLPPIQSRDVNYLKRKAAYLRQTVRLTGLNIEPFTETIDAVNKFFEMLSTAIASKEIIPWQKTSYEGNEAVDASARYFTLRKFVPDQRGRAFVAGVDPHGLLSHIRGQDFIHGEDNRVDYLREYKNKKQQIKLTRVEPSIFKAGDIVRATISFVVFPVKEKNAMMTLVLKALTHIESIPNKDTRKKTTPRPDVPKVNNIKRKVIYDEMKETSDAIDDMNISGEE